LHAPVRARVPMHAHAYAWQGKPAPSCQFLSQVELVGVQPAVIRGDATGVGFPL
jgi:hypothetical protein